MAKTALLLSLLCILGFQILLIACTSYTDPQSISQKEVDATVVEKQRLFAPPTTYFVIVRYQDVVSRLGVSHGEFRQYEIGDSIRLCFSTWGRIYEDGTIEEITGRYLHRLPCEESGK